MKDKFLQKGVFQNLLVKLDFLRDDEGKSKGPNSCMDRTCFPSNVVMLQNMEKVTTISNTLNGKYYSMSDLTVIQPRGN